MRWISLVLGVALTGCMGDGACLADLTVGEHRFRVQIAEERADQERGLMGVTGLADDRGMLFIWDEARERSFYMKDTLIPLDLVSIDEWRVTAIATMVPCEADPCPTTRTGIASSALEVNAGRTEELGIQVGAPVTLDRRGC